MKTVIAWNEGKRWKEEEKAEPDVSIFPREMRGWHSPMAWISREEGFLWEGG